MTRATGWVRSGSASKAGAIPCEADDLQAGVAGLFEGAGKGGDAAKGGVLDSACGCAEGGGG